MWNLIFLFTGAIFILLLLIIFFKKDVLKTIENKLFKYLIVLNCFEYFTEISLQVFVRTVGINNAAVDMFSRLYLIAIFAWFTVFSVYTFAICLNQNKKEKYDKIFKKIKNIHIVIIIAGIILLLLLPFEKFYETEKMYTHGLAIDALKLSLGIFMIVWIVLLGKNFKQLKDKKYIPIFLILLILVANVIIQSIDPSILIASMGATLVCYTMSFTIENPDMRLLEEAHKAKEISDNANEEKSLFVYNLTQEIRGITGKINDDADVILESKKVDEIHDIARDIKARTSEFTSMTNEILDVDSIDSSTIKIYNDKYNIKTIIKQLVNVYGDICKNKELKFRTSIDHDIPDNLYGDGINLKEVLNTILSNSTKYTLSGFVEFNVNTIIKNDICRLIFTIEDSGPGIKSEDINKIKVDDKSLSKANKLVTLMNGTMLISSDYGVGTKVKVILDQKIVEAEETEVSKYESILDNITILSVDDNEAGLKIIEKLLKGTKVKLDLVNTGKECLDKIKTEKYDLILLDEDLSQISGLELMTKINEVRNFKTPVILLTKDNSYEYNEEYLKVGFTDYILKPMKKEELLEKIDKYTKKDKK